MEDKKSKQEGLKITRIPVDDPEYMSEVPEHMKNKDFPGFPSTTVLCGPPGRGKTNALMNLLHNKAMWNKFFDEIEAYGPTVKSDKLYKTIKLKEENICTDVKKIIPKLDKSLAAQTKKVEENSKSAPKKLFLFEDMTSFFDKVQNKPEFIRCYTQIRHVKASSITMVHKYKAFNRTCRICSQHLLIWRTNNRDIEQIFEEFGPLSMDKKQWRDMVEYAFTPTEENPKPFLYINTLADDHLQFRKSFTEILELRPNQERYGIMSNRNPRKSLREEAQRPRERSRSPTHAVSRGRSRSPNNDREHLKRKRH
jgi:hypothetical protein